MRLSEAKALCADLLWRACDARLYAEEIKLLAARLAACSPRITGEQNGIFLLDASGLALTGGESRFCAKILKTAAICCYTESRVGIANSAFAARVASCSGERRWHIVPPGQDAEFLAPLPVEHLPLAADLLQSLGALGITTMGLLARLSEKDLAERFGIEGVKAKNLASGIDCQHPALPSAEKSFRYSMDLGYPLESISQATFMLKPLLARLATDLKEEGLSAERLSLAFYNDGNKLEERRLDLIRPCNQARFLLEIARLSLETSPIKREFSGIQIEVPNFSPEPRIQATIPQLDEPAAEKSDVSKQKDSLRDMPDTLLLLAQKLSVRSDENIVVYAVPNDQHAPELAGIWKPVLEDSACVPELSVDEDYLHMYSGSLAGGLTLSVLRDPLPALVKIGSSHPAAIHWHGQWRTVVAIDGPEFLSGMWWDSPYCRSYYTVALEDRIWSNDISPLKQKAMSRQESRSRADTNRLPSLLSHGKRHVHDQEYNHIQASPSNVTLVQLVHDHRSNRWLINGFFD